MKSTKQNYKINNIPEPLGPSDVYYSLDNALEVAEELPKLEKGVLGILKDLYDITQENDVK